MDGWERTFHAYGAAADAGDVLDVIRRGDEDTWVTQHPGAVWWRLLPYSYFWSALRAEGRITPATVLALRYLVPAIRSDDFGGEDPTLRWAAAWWLRDVIRALTDADLDDARRMAVRRDDPDVREWLDEYLRADRSIYDWTDRDEPGRVLMAAAVVDGFDLLPSLFEPLSSLLTPHVPGKVRAASACAVAALVGHPGLGRHREWVAAYLAAEAGQESSDYREVLVLELGLLGGDTMPWLADPHVGVRVAAALAPGLAGDETATAVLRAASLDPVAAAIPFVCYSAQRMPSLLRAVAEALCDRADDFTPLLDSALAALGHEQRPEEKRVGDVPAEPYLGKAFPRGLPHDPTEAQRIFARAVADSEAPWAGDRRWAAVFARTGLPAGREAWREACLGSPSGA